MPLLCYTRAHALYAKATLFFNLTASPFVAKPNPIEHRYFLEHIQSVLFLLSHGSCSMGYVHDG